METISFYFSLLKTTRMIEYLSISIFSHSPFSSSFPFYSLYILPNIILRVRLIGVKTTSNSLNGKSPFGWENNMKGTQQYNF